MIENKIIEITKENTFDRDWAIFTQIEKEFKSDVNSPSIQEIVNKLTFASQIDFILSDCVFHRRLYEAILWSFNQGGLILNLTYKNDDTVMVGASVSHQLTGAYPGDVKNADYSDESTNEVIVLPPTGKEEDVTTIPKILSSSVLGLILEKIN